VAGAPSAMQFALRYPERTTALVLLVPAAYPTQIEQRSEGAIPKENSSAPGLRFNAALKSDLLFWAVTCVAPGIMRSMMLATPAQDIENAGFDEQAPSTSRARASSAIRPVGTSGLDTSRTSCPR
jgi:2-hydroxy-6-oxonona-2,4-dienedioate hydrolase